MCPRTCSWSALIACLFPSFAFVLLWRHLARLDHLLMATDRLLRFEKKKKKKSQPTRRKAPYAGVIASRDDVCGFVCVICEQCLVPTCTASWFSIPAEEGGTREDSSTGVGLCVTPITYAPTFAVSMVTPCPLSVHTHIPPISVSSNFVVVI